MTINCGSCHTVTAISAAGHGDKLCLLYYALTVMVVDTMTGLISEICLAGAEFSGAKGAAVHRPALLQ